MNKSKKTTTVVLLIAVLMVSAFVGAQLVVTVKAAGYTEYVGTLNGAHFVVRFPDPWNGMLTILCRGYSPTPVLDARTSTYNSSATAQLNKGYAIAASTYGAGGWCILKGVNATYELTRYLIDTYHITGKVFLFGMAMGGGVALLLAEKYPNLYSGVLEISGVGDAKSRYSYAATIANMTIPEIRSYLNVPPINPDAMLQAIKYLEGNVTQDMIAETGGTPEEKPKAYEDRSPMYHANITIPVISIHSSGDLVVPLSVITAYQTAVANAGRSSLYRLYITPPNIPGTGHIDANVQAQVGARWDELYALSNSIGEYRGWKVVPSDGRIYIIPPQSATGIVGCQQIGTWDAEYYGKLGKTIADAAKPSIDESISNCGSKYPTP